MIKVACEDKKLIPHKQDALAEELRKIHGPQFLQQIINNSYDSMFVTDRYGNVLLANSGTGKFMETKSKEMIGKNVKDFVQSHVYDWSPDHGGDKNTVNRLGYCEKQTRTSANGYQ